MLESKLRSLLKEDNSTTSTQVDVVVTSEVDSNNSLNTSIVNVMTAYQDANRWMDSIKEDLLINKGAVFFSNYVHDLAHTMPVRFDKFGDILHTRNIIVPYPATTSIPYGLDDCNSIFNALFEILDRISKSLREFIKITQDTEYHSMACKTEELLIDIDSEYENLFKMKKVYEMSQDIVRFDKWVKQFLG